MRENVVLPLVALLVLTAPVCQGLVTYHGADEPVPSPDNWPKPLQRLIRDETRVLTMVGPMTDHRTWYAGDTARLNRFLRICGEVETPQRTVILHPGKSSVRSPDDENRRHAVDWELHIREQAGGEDETGLVKLELHVWLGGDIVLQDLQAPVELEVRSSGEIEAFVRRHQEARRQDERTGRAATVAIGEGRVQYADSALHQAAENGRIGEVNHLLDHGADPGLRDEFGRTALHYAAAGGHEQTAMVLIAKGADRHVLDDNGLSPRQLALNHGHAQTAQALATGEPVR